MDEDILNDLAAEIAHDECVLFAGAGLSMQGGGLSWKELPHRTADEFDYGGGVQIGIEGKGEAFFECLCQKTPASAVVSPSST